MTSEKEVPMLNKDNFVRWIFLMKLHLGGLGNHAKSTLTTEHFNIVGALTIEDMKKRKEHN